MKFHHLGRYVAAVAVALTAWPTMAQESEGTSAKSTLLQSEIEVTWQDKAQGLAQLLADRLGVPFTSAVPLDTQVSVKQAGGSTVANLISTVNYPRLHRVGTTRLFLPLQRSNQRARNVPLPRMAGEHKFG